MMHRVLLYLNVAPLLYSHTLCQAVSGPPPYTPLIALQSLSNSSNNNGGILSSPSLFAATLTPIGAPTFRIMTLTPSAPATITSILPSSEVSNSKSSGPGTGIAVGSSSITTLSGQETSTIPGSSSTAIVLQSNVNAPSRHSTAAGPPDSAASTASTSSNPDLTVTASVSTVLIPPMYTALVGSAGSTLSGSLSSSGLASASTLSTSGAVISPEYSTTTISPVVKTSSGIPPAGLTSTVPVSVSSLDNDAISAMQTSTASGTSSIDPASDGVVSTTTSASSPNIGLGSFSSILPSSISSSIDLLLHEMVSTVTVTIPSPGIAFVSTETVVASLSFTSTSTATTQDVVSSTIPGPGSSSSPDVSAATVAAIVISEPTENTGGAAGTSMPTPVAGSLVAPAVPTSTLQAFTSTSMSSVSTPVSSPSSQPHTVSGLGSPVMLSIAETPNTRFLPNLSSGAASQLSTTEAVCMATVYVTETVTVYSEVTNNCCSSFQPIGSSVSAPTTPTVSVGPTPTVVTIPSGGSNQSAPTGTVPGYTEAATPSANGPIPSSGSVNLVSVSLGTDSINSARVSPTAPVITTTASASGTATSAVSVTVMTIPVVSPASTAEPASAPAGVCSAVSPATSGPCQPGQSKIFGPVVVDVVMALPSTFSTVTVFTATGCATASTNATGSATMSIGASSTISASTTCTTSTNGDLVCSGCPGTSRGINCTYACTVVGEPNGFSFCESSDLTGMVDANTAVMECLPCAGASSAFTFAISEPVVIGFSTAPAASVTVTQVPSSGLSTGASAGSSSELEFLSQASLLATTTIFATSPALYGAPITSSIAVVPTSVPPYGAVSASSSATYTLVALSTPLPLTTSSSTSAVAAAVTSSTSSIVTSSGSSSETLPPETTVVTSLPQLNTGITTGQPISTLAVSASSIPRSPQAATSAAVTVAAGTGGTCTSVAPGTKASPAYTDPQTGLLYRIQCGTTIDLVSQCPYLCSQGGGGLFRQCENTDQSGPDPTGGVGIICQQCLPPCGSSSSKRDIIANAEQKAEAREGSRDLRAHEAKDVPLPVHDDLNWLPRGGRHDMPATVRDDHMWPSGKSEDAVLDIVNDDHNGHTWLIRHNELSPKTFKDDQIRLPRHDPRGSSEASGDDKNWLPRNQVDLPESARYEHNTKWDGEDESLIETINDDHNGQTWLIRGNVADALREPAGQGRAIVVTLKASDPTTTA